MVDSPDELPMVVVFDVGETLVDETRSWAAVADAAGVTTLTLFGALGVLIERRADHRQVWELLGVTRPPMTVDIRPDDLYPDVVRNLAALVTAGLRIGLAGNRLTELRPLSRDSGYLSPSLRHRHGGVLRSRRLRSSLASLKRQRRRLHESRMSVTASTTTCFPLAMLGCSPCSCAVDRGDTRTRTGRKPPWLTHGSTRLTNYQPCSRNGARSRARGVQRRSAGRIARTIASAIESALSRPAHWR
jgi:hypothetical protein